jgi:hypothetical protein
MSELSPPKFTFGHLRGRELSTQKIKRYLLLFHPKSSNQTYSAVIAQRKQQTLLISDYIFPVSVGKGVISIMRCGAALR